MSKTIEMIKAYVPFNQQEEKDKQFFIDCENLEQILTRDNKGAIYAVRHLLLTQKEQKFYVFIIIFLIFGYGLVGMPMGKTTCLMLQLRKQKKKHH